MQNAERDISILVQSKSIIKTWSTLGITPYILYGMVNAMLSVKSGQGQPLVNPGDGRWLIVQLPYGQALSPTSHVPVPAGEYEISLRQQGLDCYPRPEIQQLNWDKEDKTKRDRNVRSFIR